MAVIKVPGGYGGTSQWKIAEKTDEKGLDSLDAVSVLLSCVC